MHDAHASILRTILRTLLRVSPTSETRALRADVELALAHGRPTDAEVSAIVETAERLAVTRSRSNVA